MRILVGSSAVTEHIPEFTRNYIQDVDLWVDENEKGYTCSDASIMNSSLLELFSEESKSSGIATPSDVMTIKLSHLPWDIKWWKHAQDYLVLKMKYKCEINKPLYEALKLLWKVEHKDKPYLSLYKTKDEFFDDYVVKKLDHDLLHELVSHPNKPIYISCLKENEEVAIDKEKFSTLDFSDKVKMFREEINVIAVERWIINPRLKVKIPFREAYHRSLNKTVTALTKGWASEFICENLEYFIKPNKKEVEYCLNSVDFNSKL